MANRKRTWGESYIQTMSSAKRLSERLVVPRACRRIDTSHRIVYQINSDGEIVRQWKDVAEICDVFKTYDAKVRQAMNNKKVIGGCLFVPMVEYKTTTNYKILIKILTNKLIKLDA
jgi:hypothetical protein